MSQGPPPSRMKTRSTGEASEHNLSSELRDIREDQGLARLVAGQLHLGFDTPAFHIDPTPPLLPHIDYPPEGRPRLNTYPPPAHHPTHGTPVQRLARQFPGVRAPFGTISPIPSGALGRYHPSPGIPYPIPVQPRTKRRSQSDTLSTTQLRPAAKKLQLGRFSDYRDPALVDEQEPHFGPDSDSEDEVFPLKQEHVFGKSSKLARSPVKPSTPISDPSADIQQQLDSIHLSDYQTPDTSLTVYRPPVLFRQPPPQPRFLVTSYLQDISGLTRQPRVEDLTNLGEDFGFSQQSSAYPLVEPVFPLFRFPSSYQSATFHIRDPGAILSRGKHRSSGQRPFVTPSVPPSRAFDEIVDDIALLDTQVGYYKASPLATDLEFKKIREFGTKLKLRLDDPQFDTVYRDKRRIAIKRIDTILAYFSPHPHTGFQPPPVGTPSSSPPTLTPPHIVRTPTPPPTAPIPPPPGRPPSPPPIVRPSLIMASQVFYSPPGVAVLATIYDGQSSCEEFVRQWELLSVSHGWKEEDKLRFIALHLSGSAKIWYELYRRTVAETNGTTYEAVKLDYKILIKELKDAFSSRDTFESHLQRLKKVKFVDYTTVQAYVYAVLQILNKMQKDMPDDRKISYLLQGLPSALAKSIFLTNPKTPADIKSTLISYEKFNSLFPDETPRREKANLLSSSDTAGVSDSLRNMSIQGGPSGNSNTRGRGRGPNRGQNSRNRGYGQQNSGGFRTSPHPKRGRGSTARGNWNSRTPSSDARSRVAPPFNIYLNTTSVNDDRRENGWDSSRRTPSSSNRYGANTPRTGSPVQARSSSPSAQRYRSPERRQGTQPRSRSPSVGSDYDVIDWAKKQRQDNKGNVLCYHCLKPGHVVADCYERKRLISRARDLQRQIQEN
jgi:hypothetical protein